LKCVSSTEFKKPKKEGSEREIRNKPVSKERNKIRRMATNIAGVIYNTNVRHLTMGARSGKCVFRRFLRCANVYSHKLGLYSLAYYKPRLYYIALGYKA